MEDAFSQTFIHSIIVSRPSDCNSYPLSLLVVSYSLYFSHSFFCCFEVCCSFVDQIRSYPRVPSPVQPSVDYPPPFRQSFPLALLPIVWENQPGGGYTSEAEGGYH